MREQYFNPVDIPELPEIDADYLPGNVQVHFAFGAHSEAQDFDAPSALLKESDIFIPELVGWSEADLSWLRRVSRSNQTNFEKLLRNRLSPLKGRVEFDDYFYELAGELQGQNTTVLLVDADKDSKTAKDVITEVVNANCPGNFEDEIDDTYRYVHMMVETSARRNKIILENLGPFVTEAITRHPKLVEEPTVKALVVLGASHQQVYRHLNSSPHTVGKVRASCSVSYGGDVTDQYKHEICDKIAEEQPIARNELVSLWIAPLVDVLIRRRTTAQELGKQRIAEARKELFHLLVEGIDAGAPEALYHLINNQPRPGDKELLGEYAAKVGV